VAYEKLLSHLKLRQTLNLHMLSQMHHLTQSSKHLIRTLFVSAPLFFELADD
jgi:hypothetical protein